MATLPKPNGGERQICLLGMITRLWGRCRASLARQWDSSACQHWDKAIAGSSSLRAAIWRLAGDESCKLLGFQSCSFA
eukprot:11613893-Alexandrium_andersonii.AAC.1